MDIADMPSQVYLTNHQALAEKDFEFIHQAQYLHMHGSTQLWVKQATAEDPTIQCRPWQQ